MTERPIFGRRSVLAGTATMLAAPGLARAQQAPAAPSSGTPAAGQSAVIDVTRARTEPIPIAIPDLVGGGAEAQRIGSDMAGVITNDLQNCGLFRPISPQAFVADTGAVPNFQNWKAIGAQALVTGRVEGEGGNVRVEFRLWDVLPGTQIQGTAYTTSSANWRRIAHIIADVVYERLLGEKGYFDTRIAYVARTGPRGRQTTRLAIMDQDGANNRFLTDGTWMVLTPRFHPTRDEIAFMSYAGNRPRVYLFDLGSGRQRVLGDFAGMTLSPRFSPDGNSVIMSLAHGSGADIVVVGLGGGGERRLTNSGAIDVSPCYSPDGSQIVFNSDRGGDQQLYVMDASGGNVRRISFGNGRYGTPVWSPRGDLIAFTRIGDTFGIGVMHPDGSGERILSEGFDVEGPTFCPNGRVLMFWRTTAARGPSGAGYSARLVTIDITGFDERPVPTPTNASDPSWSPLNA
ncbi:MAG TPA: Tol-Pal system beta propeller repeat protein TolB [Acetobacteraceae bacterium]|nr:Tol-Pal system beta propeller repeat protein TolB [Acetobacteraceae bacterium]